MYRPVIRCFVLLLFVVSAEFIVSGTLAAQWQQTNGPSGHEINALFAAPDTTYAATSGGLYFTADGAVTWQLLGFPGQHVNYVWGHNAILIVGVFDSAVDQYVTLYRSSDRGLSWTNNVAGLLHNT